MKESAKKKPLGIYLHIPFCRQKCLYCDFLSAPAGEETVERYVDALCRQIALEAEGFRDCRVRTVFLGGGTPSVLTVRQMDRVLSALFSCFGISDDAEITAECNPGTLDFEKLAGYRRAGINRLSIGLQSAQDRELACLGRIHNYGTFLRNYDQARRAGFSNINVDLMSALPGQTLERWMDTLEKTVSLGPEHISAYSLIIEEGTPFFQRYGESGAEAQTGQPPLPDEELDRRMYEETGRFLAKHGYMRYEISNYARPGYECRHNAGYWERTDYLGLGLGASSLIDPMRWRVSPDLEEYLRFFGPASGAGSPDRKDVCLGADPKAVRRDVQRLSRRERMEEFMFLGLRLTKGISASRFRKAFGRRLQDVYGPALEKLKREGLIAFSEDGERLFLTDRGIDVSNYALAEFLF